MKRIALTVVAILFSSHLYAGPFSYECKIDSDYSVNSSGELAVDSLQLYAGKTFHVDRQTGTVLGGGVGNSSYPNKQILDVGSEDQSFKLLWVSQPVMGLSEHRNVVFLSVAEFEEQDKKPFLLVYGTNVLSGLCE